MSLDTIRISLSYLVLVSKYDHIDLSKATILDFVVSVFVLFIQVNDSCASFVNFFNISR